MEVYKDGVKAVEGVDYVIKEDIVHGIITLKTRGYFTVDTNLHQSVSTLKDSIIPKKNISRYEDVRGID